MVGQIHGAILGNLMKALIVYRVAQLRDQHSGRSLMPLAEALAIPAYDHYLKEPLEPGIGLSVQVSYGVTV